jgi:nitrogen-specific signal transduction histidine kinase
LERSLDPSAGEVDAYPQEITRVLLNLIANANCLDRDGILDRINTRGLIKI